MVTPAKRRKLSQKQEAVQLKSTPKPKEEEPVDFHKIVQQGNLKQLCDVLYNSSSRTGINKLDNAGRKPVILAAELGLHLFVKELIKVRCHYINEQVEEEKWEFHSPMHAAIANNRIQVVKTLLKHGVSPDRCTFYSKFTPLMAACVKGNAEIVSLLLEHGAKLEAKSNLNALTGHYYTDRHYYTSYFLNKERLVKTATPLVYAVVSNHTECAKLLIAAGAKDPGNVHIPKAWAANVNMVHYPLKNGNLPLVKLLVETFGGQSSPHGNGISWLSLVVRMHGAATSGSMGTSRVAGNGRLSSVGRKALLANLGKSLNYLISIGCDVNGMPSTEKIVRNPLYFAVQNGDRLMTNRLLKFGARLNLENNEEPTLEQVAVKTKNTEIVKTLLNHRAEFICNGTENMDGVITVKQSAPILSAVIQDDINMVKLLLSSDKHNSVRRIVTESNNQTPLMYFLQFCPINLPVCRMSKNKTRICMIDLLLNAGVPLNATDASGKTALSLACLKGSSEKAVVHLLKLGALTNISCKLGNYPLTASLRQAAVQYNNIVQLIQHGANVNVSHWDNFPLTERSSFYMLFCNHLSRWKSRPEVFIFIVKCLKLAGYKFVNEDLALLKTSVTDPDNKARDLYTNALEIATEFTDLMTVCRACVVQSIKGEYKKAIGTLPLPTIMKKYLLYEDLPRYGK